MKTRPTRARSSRSRRAIAAALEALESRRLLCGAVHAAGQHLIATAALTDEALAAQPQPPARLASQPPLPGLPLLSSRPGAFAKLFIDFDGDVTPSWGGFSPGTTPAYNTDADPNTIGQGEADQITHMWARVAEKFAPFNLDVTTIDPGNLNNGQTLKAVVGGNGSWYGGGAGGVAYVDGFTNGLPNAVFIFPLVYGGNINAIAETVAHEAGHGFGLLHQSAYDVNGNKIAEYSPGDGNRAPIMGSSGSAPRGMWWLGPSSASAGDIQDDLAVLSRPQNGFGYRPDDLGSTVGTATPMASAGPNAFTASGLIERTTDADVFSFTVAQAGPLNLRTAVATSLFGRVGVLDSSLELLNASGTVIAQASNANALNESLNVNVTPGQYYAIVRSHGGYADLGQYTVSATLNPDTTPPSLTSSAFVFQSAHELVFTFSEDVSGSLDTGDLAVTNLGSSEVFVADILTYGPGNMATLSFATPLPDGNYTAAFSAGGAVTDPFGNALVASAPLSFFVFAGDVNRDRLVNVADFANMAGNFNGTNRAFGQGDFNYDRSVNIADFAILAARFNTSLPLPRVAAPLPGLPDAGPTPFGDRSILDDVLA